MPLQTFLIAKDDPDFRLKMNIPGAVWLCPWMVERGMLENDWYFSIYYREEYSKVRAPICVCCPDGSHWMVDSKSSNGPGWQVSGDLVHLTCTPSIMVSNYHGFLRDGVFSDDLEGRTY